MSEEKPTPYGGTGQVLKQFQLDPLSIKDKSDKAFGLSIAQYIDSTVWGQTNSYYFTRNARYRLNRNAANGRVNMAKFQDLLEFNSKINYANLNWNSIKIVNRIVSGLVGRWMGRNEKISVTAMDSLSVKDKEEEYNNIDFIINNREALEKLQAESGVPMIPQNQPLPSDQEELNLWQSQFQKIPEEILYELGCNDVLESNGWFDVLKQKMLHDAVEVGLVGTYTWMDEDGVIHVEWVQPENAVYSYSSYPDFRDTTWRGRIRTMKISELRKKYGKEFGGELTEQQLWEIAQTAKDYQLYDKLRWMTEWNISFLRPYDEWNVDVLEFELKTVDTDPYTITKTKSTGSTIVQKGLPKTRSGKPRETPSDNQEVIGDTHWNIYRGVYIRSPQTLLEWGLKTNMIRPQDPKEIGNAEFSYSFYMYQNYDMRNVAVPEKIEEPAEQMILARLKMQQLVAKMRPTGSAINWDALQEIDYGLGDANKTIDVKKLYDQTGDIYYRGRDAEGNPIPVPITELQNSGFLSQMQGLIQLYQFHYQVLRDELGEDPNLLSQAIQPRVAAGNVEASQQQAEFATDYMYDAYKYVMADTARKISCLLHKSVVYGSTAYRELLNEKDVQNRIFSTRIEMLPDAIQIQKFEAMLNAGIQSNQDLQLFVNPFQLMRIAKEDVKLAEVLFRNGQKKMIAHQMQTAQQNQQATIQGQIQSAQAAEQAKQQTETVRGGFEIERARVTGEMQNKSAVVQMITSLYTKNGEIPAELQPFANAVMQNIMLPLVSENEQQQQQIMQQMAMAQQQAQNPNQQPDQSQQLEQQMEQGQQIPEQEQNLQPA